MVLTMFVSTKSSLKYGEKNWTCRGETIFEHCYKNKTFSHRSIKSLNLYLIVHNDTIVHVKTIMVWVSKMGLDL